MRHWAIAAGLVMAVGLSACTGSPPLDTASTAPAVGGGAVSAPDVASPKSATPSSPVPVGQARVTVTRPSGLLYSGVPASIAVDGQNVANIWPGSSATFDVPAGARTITASSWSYPQERTMRLEARAGAAYAIEVVPREASLGPTMILGPFAGVIDKDAQGNGGAFELRLLGG